MGYGSRHNSQFQEAVELEAERPVRQRRRWRVPVTIFITMLVAVVCGVVAYAIFLVTSVAKISTDPYNITGLAVDSGGRVNVLVLGVGDTGHAGEKLSDTVLLLGENITTKRAGEVSIPRDLRVFVDGHGSMKVNAVHAVGGPDLAMATMHEVLSTPVDYYIRTNFTGLKSIVDVVGGLDVAVKERLYDPEYPCDDNQYKVCGLDIAPGLHHMNGTQVLQYVRCRKGTCGNDFGRAARQQEVLDLLKVRLTGWDIWLSPAKVNALVAAMRQFVQTNMSAWQMVQFALNWNEYTKDQPPAKLVLSTSPGGMLTGAAGSSDLVPIGGDFSAIAQKVSTLLD